MSFVRRLAGMFEVCESLDRDYLQKIRENGANLVEVDRAFFGPAVDAWYAEWRARAPPLQALEQKAAGL